MSLSVSRRRILPHLGITGHLIVRWDTEFLQHLEHGNVRILPKGFESRLSPVVGPSLYPLSGRNRRSPRTLGAFGGFYYGGTDETRTRDLLRDRQAF